MTTQTALDRIKETLATLEMDSLTRHWLEEDLSHLTSQERIEDLEQEVYDLQDQNYELEEDRSTLEDDIYELRQRIEELESVYEPGVH